MGSTVAIHNAAKADVPASIWGLSFFAWLPLPRRAAYQFGTSKIGRPKRSTIQPVWLTQFSSGES